MSAPAAISGDFATYKHIQGRKVLQLVIEVPAEMASAVFAALGTPGAGEGIPVALARLGLDLAKREQPKPEEHRPFTKIPYSQQAAMRCANRDFETFLYQRQGPDGVLQIEGDIRDPVAGHVRHLCGVRSRSEIVKGTPAGDRWAALEAEFYAWQRGRR